MDKVLYPWAAATEIVAPFEAPIFETSEEIFNNKTLIDVGQMTDDSTFDMPNLSGELKEGAVIYLKISADGTTRTFTLGAGTDGSSFSVASNSTVNVQLYFDGTQFNKI